MKHYLGLNEYSLRQRQQEIPVVYEPETLINAHLLLCGMSGTGKTHQSVRLLNSASKAGLCIDVFDVHEELHTIAGAMPAKYSQATGHGYNPLVLDVDPHAGGVNRQADFLVGLVKQVTPQFGAKQEAALRNLIIDVYAARGIWPDNPKSWNRKRITVAHRRELIDGKRWTDLREFYPTLDDLLEYAERKVLVMMFGGDNKAMSSLEALCRMNSRLQAMKMRLHKAGDVESERKRLEGQIAVLEDELVDTYSTAVKSKPGREPKELIKYDSKDVLISVVQRLQILASAGIFNANEPDFRGSRVKVHQIKSLQRDQQIMLVKLRIAEIFEQLKQMGPTASGTEVRHIVFLDESAPFFCDDVDDILNVVPREARKFGLGLWLAAQEPSAFPQSFITNCGCKILLGIDSSFWKPAISKLRITEEGLKYVKPKEVLTIKLQREGQADPPFVNVVVPNPKSEAGQRATRRAA